MTTATLPPNCPACRGALSVEKLRCKQCGTSVEGAFPVPRLGRLNREEQQFLELFVLSSGSLKTVAKKMSISYPTVRKLLDRLMEHLAEEIACDEAERQEILRAAESGSISLDEAKEKLKKI